VFQRLLNRIASELKRRSIPYMVIGGQAVLLSGRPRDLEDVRSILLKNPQYDSGYIERWLKEFEDSLGQSFLTVYRSVLQEIA